MGMAAFGREVVTPLESRLFPMVPSSPPDLRFLSGGRRESTAPPVSEAVPKCGPLGSNSPPSTMLRTAIAASTAAF
ncbi:hypothetical protein ZIOFF_000413 [Zingiber officinale]|uniref:Uncharacterized protein n=1 Tax=Zingiber officinale TaxID=94328 RepID=A0A8J5LXW6_ZINOF|nr:hypothetical protein ZIOFF_000413 [Zingiber officinale]